MRVRCQKCQGTFEAPLKSGGNIEYAHCENVFRVTYRFRTPCRNCKAVLQLVPHGTDEATGIPLTLDANEKTQALDLSLAGEPTIRQIPSSPPSAVTPATVRVRRKKENPEPEPAKFMITARQDLHIQKPLHVSLKGGKKPGRSSWRFDLRKIFLFGLIGISTAVSATLIILAVQNGKDPKPAVEVVQKASLPRTEPHLNSATRPETGVENPLNPTPRHAVPPDDDRTVDPISYDAPEPGEESKTFLVKRLDRVTSKYGERLDPIDYTPKFHHGLDIAEPHHAEILAAMDGTVKYAGWKGGYGNVVILKHDDGYETTYGHLARILVKQGKFVKQGKVVGLAGSTGRSTGTHLHFEVKKDGKAVDPYRVELMSRVSRSS